MFKELYYWLYKLSLKRRNNNDSVFDAFLGISFFQGMNILTLLGVVNYFLALDISKNNSIYLGIFIYVITTFINYFSLFRLRNAIINKYEELPRERRNKGKLFFLLYCLLTIVLFMCMIIYLVKPKY